MYVCMYDCINKCMYDCINECMYDDLYAVGFVVVLAARGGRPLTRYSQIVIPLCGKVRNSIYYKHTYGHSTYIHAPSLP